MAGKTASSIRTSAVLLWELDNTAFAPDAFPKAVGSRRCLGGEAGILDGLTVLTAGNQVSVGHWYQS
jgi:hypothetical protein